MIVETLMYTKTVSFTTYIHELHRYWLPKKCAKDFFSFLHPQSNFPLEGIRVHYDSMKDTWFHHFPAGSWIGSWQLNNNFDENKGLNIAQFIFILSCKYSSFIHRILCFHLNCSCVEKAGEFQCYCLGMRRGLKMKISLMQHLSTFFFVVVYVFEIVMFL